MPGGSLDVRGIRAIWATLAVLLVGGALALGVASPRFGYDYEIAATPILPLTAGLVAAGLLFLPLPLLIVRSSALGPAIARGILALVLVAGLAARLALITSEPALEDDYQRYLWDGAVSARLINPYAHAPEAALRDGDNTALGRLAGEAGLVVLRLNHRDLRTIYPPVTQAAFALAHVIKPWSLAAWRVVLLAFDAATLLLLLALLKEADRSPLWSALYWWHPVLLKEIYNSAHMEVVLLPFVLLALLLTLKRRPVLAAASLAFAVGAKVWPALLLPLILRPIAGNRRALVAALAVFGGLCLLWLLPIAAGGFDESSGFVAYVERWKSNSALFPALETLSERAFSLIGLDPAHAGVAVRFAIAAGLGLMSLLLARRDIAGADDLIGRTALLVAALVLFSPAQFPWYGLWLAPFLVFRPWWGFVLLAATVPLYYTAFHFSSTGQPHIFRNGVVWCIWAPVWIALASEWLLRRQDRREVRTAGAI